MVALGRLLLLFQISLQILLGGERGAVDPLQHLVLLVAAEVAARDRQQLHRADLAGVRDVRPAAEVDEITGFVKGDLRILRDVGQTFEFVGLSGFGKHLLRIGPVHLRAFKRQLAADQLLHRLFDRLQVLGDQPVLHIEVVIKTVLGGGPDIELRIGVKLLHRRRHHVRGTVADRFQRIVAHDSLAIM